MTGSCMAATVATIHIEYLQGQVRSGTQRGRIYVTTTTERERAVEPCTEAGKSMHRRRSSREFGFVEHRSREVSIQSHDRNEPLTQVSFFFASSATQDYKLIWFGGPAITTGRREEDQSVQFTRSVH
jgi:hypothetical protein